MTALRRATIAALTYRRPAELARLLNRLGTLLAHGTVDRPAGWDIDVLIVDNSPDGDAAEQVHAAAAALAAATAAPGRADRDGGIALRYVREPHPGIAAARGRAMGSVEGRDVVVFVDDDEDPQSGWLAALLQTWQVTGAVAVAGRIVPDYPEGIDRRLIEGGFFVRRDLPTGTRIEAAPAGNLLLDVRQVARLGITFSPELGLRGGEDTLFTRQLHRAGGLLVFCRDSVVVDPVPTDRATMRWVAARIWGHGSNEADMRVRVSGAGGLREAGIRARTAAGGIVRVGYGALRTLDGTLRRDVPYQAKGVRTVLRGAGMVAGALGRPYAEYARAGASAERAHRDTVSS